jgi:hypothetical protein
LPGVAVTLTFRSDRRQRGHGNAAVTGHDGRFQFQNLSTGFGQYWITVAPRSAYQPGESPLALGGPPVDIQLKAGHTIEGRLLDAATGEALPGVELHAQPVPQPRRGPYRYETEKPVTDVEGRFRFSTLPEGTYCVRIQGWPSSSATSEEHIFRTGEMVALRVTPPEKK